MLVTHFSKFLSPFPSLSACVYFESPWGVALCILSRVLFVFVGKERLSQAYSNWPHLNLEHFLLLALNFPTSSGSMSLSCRSPLISPFPKLLPKTHWIGYKPPLHNPGLCCSCLVIPTGDDSQPLHLPSQPHEVLGI